MENSQTNEILDGLEENAEGEIAEEVDTLEADGEPEELPAEQGESLEELEGKKQALADEIAMLDAELESKRAQVDKRAREYSEFKELYPEIEISEIAPEVIESAEAGVPLAAAYALYEKRLAARAEAAKAHNKATKESGFGSVGKNTASEFFSPDEVRAMSATEVHANYQKILRSMKSWG